MKTGIIIGNSMLGLPMEATSGNSQGIHLQ